MLSTILPQNISKWIWNNVNVFTRKYFAGCKTKISTDSIFLGSFRSSRHIEDHRVSSRPRRLSAWGRRWSRRRTHFGLGMPHRSTCIWSWSSEKFLCTARCRWRSTISRTRSRGPHYKCLKYNILTLWTLLHSPPPPAFNCPLHSQFFGLPSPAECGWPINQPMTLGLSKWSNWKLAIFMIKCHMEDCSLYFLIS